MSEHVLTDLREPCANHPPEGSYHRGTIRPQVKTVPGPVTVTNEDGEVTIRYRLEDVACPECGRWLHPFSGFGLPLLRVGARNDL